MRRILPLSFLLVVLIGCKEKVIELAIVPIPLSMQVSGKTLPWEGPVGINESSAYRSINAIQSLKNGLAIRNIPVTDNAKNQIRFFLVAFDTLYPEGYHRLVINESGVSITADTGAGLYYGVQTLLQILPGKGEDQVLPYVDITDQPRFPYRGLHLDVGRHFFPPDFIKKYIDWLAFHKYNYFHWHLTEDQGWRIEIKKYPKLQEVSAFRKETLIGHAGPNEKFDGQRYGGFYTQEEIKEIVQYAADRYVTIIPEIEMPGHSMAALAAYPEIGCTGGPYEVATKWGVFKDVYCAGNEQTFEFVQNVLDEVIGLFPGRYIHIGGDECPKDRWKQCPKCQKRIKTEGLADEHALQSYFIQRIEKYLNDKGRQIIGWDEILEGGLAPNATVMSWRGEKGGIAAAKEKHPVIMTPGNWCYFDHYQDSAKNEPLAIGGLTPVKEVYGYEPLPSALSPEESKYILGAQANVWTEYMATTEYVEYMVYPRASAMAEVLWSPKTSRNYEDFLRRMQVHLKRLDALGIHYARHIEKEFNSSKTN